MAIKELLTWKFGAIILTAGVIIIFWDRLKKININNNNKRVVLQNPRWIKIGKIKELYYYPLKSGRGKTINSECQFTEYGIAATDAVSQIHELSVIILRDRMFIVYNKENGKFITGRNYPKLLLVSISAIDKSTVKIEATGIDKLIFELPNDKDTNNGTEVVDCSMWWGEPVKCYDCGDGPAKWISKFLTGNKDSGLRIGLALKNNNRNILKGPWKKFTKVYDTLTNDDIGLFADLASYMVVTESSLKELNKKLKKNISALQLRPNIVISGTDAFIEDHWEWIKIGESVILRNVKPCPRCKMICINPETGEADNEQEPLKTLRTFRQQTNLDRVSVDGKAPILGIYCGLYTKGKVKIGDDVFIHLPISV